MIQPICLILALLFFTAGLTAAEPADPTNPTESQPLTGKQILQKMGHALRFTNYQGTVAFLKHGKLEPMKYFHAVRDGTEQERLLSLNSPLREIVREAGKVRCIYKQSKHQLVDNKPFDRSFLVDLPANIDTLETAYAIELVGEENIAMLPAYVINLNAMDNLRYSRTFWIEKKHFLPLQATVTTPATESSTRTLEQLVFTDFMVKDNIPFVDVHPTQSPTLINEPTPLPVSQANFIINDLPKGFDELFFNRRLMHNEARPVDQLVLSDGLAWISIYMEYKKIGSPQHLSPESKTARAVGAINFFSRTLGDFEFTVMGDVPPETVKAIANSIQLRDIR